MGRSWICHKRVFFASVVLSAVATFVAQAATFGPFTYEVNGGQVEITDCDTSIKVAHLPELIEGLPVTDIATDAFKNCSSLNGILLPDSITYIEEDAFKNCGTLTRAVYLGSLPTIESNAFPNVHSEFAHYTGEWTPPSFTNGLPIIYFEGYADGLVLGGGEILTYVGLGGALPIPSVVFAEGDMIFGGYYSISSIGPEAFINCTQLSRVAIPSTISVGMGAFEGCSSLTHAVYPDAGPPSIGINAFANVHSGFTHYSRSGAPLGDGHPVIGYDVYHKGLVVGSGEILTYVGSGGTVPIPEEVADEYGESPVSFILGNAFQDCLSLTTVSIPESVTVAQDAFVNCPLLMRAVYPGTLPSFLGPAYSGVHADFRHYSHDGSSPDGYPAESYDAYDDGLVVRGGEILMYVGAGGTLPIPEQVEDELTGLHYPVTRIMEYAFQGHRSLAGVAIPETIDVGDGAFEGCSSLTRAVHLGDTAHVYSNPTIFANVHPFFAHYTRGYPVNDGHHVEVYEAYQDGMVVFGGDLLTYVGGGGTLPIPETIEDSETGLQFPVDRIREYAFYNSTALAGVAIPETVEVMYEAFEGCSSLTRAVYPDASPPYIDPYAFNDVHPDFTHYSRSGSWLGDGHPVERFDVYSEGMVVYAGELLTYVGEGGTIAIPTLAEDAFADMDIQGIRPQAFLGCTALAGVAIPETVFVQNRAFEGCSSLTRAVYPGNIPPFVDSTAFDGAHPDFKHYSRDGSSPDYHPAESYDVYQDGMVVSGGDILTYVGGGTLPIPTDIGGDPVVRIMEGAFEGCLQLAGVAIPVTVEVRDGAFEGCSSLTRAVHLGHSANVHPSAFTDVHSGFTHYTRGLSIGDGHPLEYYEAYQNGMVVFAGELLTYVGGGGTLPIPEMIEDSETGLRYPIDRIREDAFYNSTALAGVAIPETVEVRDGAFEGCSSLTRAVHLGDPANVHPAAFTDVHPFFRHYTKGFSLGDGHPVEYYDTCLDGLVVSAGDIETYVGAGGTLPIPSDYAPDPYNPEWKMPIHTISPYAFQGCTQLAGVVIPETVDVWPGAFEGCTSLTRAVYPDAGTPFIGSDAFTDVHPDFKHYSRSGTSFGDGHPVELYDVYQDGLVVRGGDVLTYVGGGTLPIPESVEDAYASSPVTRIMEHAFQSCFTLAGVAIPETVEVRDYAFEGCSSLTRAVYPDATANVSSNAFTGVHPDFKHYTKGFSIGDGHERWDYEAYVDGLVIFAGDILTYVGGGTVPIPTEYASDSLNPHNRHPVNRIQEYAFENCTQLAGVSIPETVDVMEGAFEGCSSLTRAVYPDASVPVVLDAFTGVHPDFTHYSRAGSSLGDGHPVADFDVYDDGMAVYAGEIVTYVGEGGTISIPTLVEDAFGDMDIHGIHPHAFRGCTTLAGVAIPETVYVQDGAFEGCTSLTRAVYPGNPPPMDFAFTDVHPGFKHYLRSGSSPDGHPIELYDVYQNGLVVRGGDILTFVGGGTLPIPEAVEDTYGSSPVSRIMEGAFEGCLQLAGVAIPETVEVRDGAFEGCSSLTRAVHLGYTANVHPSAFTDVHSGFTHYTKGLSIGDGHMVEYYEVYQNGLVVSGGDILTYVGAGGEVAISSEIGGNPIFLILEDAFRGCTQLAEVVIAETISWIGDGAFGNCGSLSKAYFLGDAPASFGSGVFDGAAASFGVYYWAGSAGFTSPTWQGYPSYMIFEPPSSVATWLVDHGFYLDTDLTQDFNGDGIPLLTAYALNLDPHEDLSDELPKPEVDIHAQTLGITYYAGADRVIYHVETSTNLQTWTSSGVFLSPPDMDDRVTATIDMDSPAGFMRLWFELLE